MNLKAWKIFKEVDDGIAASVRLAYVTTYFGHYRKDRTGILVTMTDDVYCIEEEGRLNSEGVPKPAVKIQSWCGKRIIDIKNTFDGIVALTNEGRVYLLEEMNDKEPPLVPGCSLESQQVVQVAAGVRHCLFLTSDGQVYAWGKNFVGQLGVGSDSVVPGAVKISFSDESQVQIKSIACWSMASYAVDNQGRVWSWGTSEWHVLGYHASCNQLEPKLIPGLRKVEKVAAGGFFIIALTNQKEVFWWGDIGEGHPVEVPTKISSPLAIVDVAATWTCEFSVLETTRDIFMFGEWHRKEVVTPYCTQFSSIDEAFLSALMPTMVRPMELRQACVRDSSATWKTLLHDPTFFQEVVKFRVNGVIIPAYKGFLIQRCDYFRSMLANDWKESEGCVDIQGFSADGFKTLIFFLYTDELMNPDMSLDELSELLRIADYYQVDSLYQICAGILKSKITLENACAMYAISVQSNAHGLQLKLIDFIAREYHQVVQSNGFSELSNELMAELARKVSQHLEFKKN